jgi:hypothetical protein
MYRKTKQKVGMRMTKGSAIGYSRAPYTSTVNKILGSSGGQVLFYQSVRRHIPENLILKVGTQRLR